MKISFGIIVFNGLKFLPKGMLEACIQNIYEIAHEILIVEGAVDDFKGKIPSHYEICFKNLADAIKKEGITPKLKNLAYTLKVDIPASGFASWASDSQGHSLDGTLKFLKNFPDPENKIQIISKDTPWDNKTQMCNAWASKATGDYIWQLDSDEFYKKNDLQRIINILKEQIPDAIYFTSNNFYGNWDQIQQEQDGGNKWMRLFRNIPQKSFWQNHAPPEYMCNGNLMNKGKVITENDTKKLGIYLYHYTQISHNQQNFKELYYQTPFKMPKTIPFTGEHPDIIKNILKNT